MKSVKGVALAAALITLPVLAQQDTPASFVEIDKNGDGVLNIEEAKAALPSVEITDANEDGIVSKMEAENSFAGLSLSPNDQGDGTAPVREPEYRMIVQILQNNAQASVTN